MKMEIDAIFGIKNILILTTYTFDRKNRVCQKYIYFFLVTMTFTLSVFLHVTHSVIKQ